MNDSVSNLRDSNNPEKLKNLQCSSTYTSRDREGHVSDLENVRNLDVEGHALVVQDLW